MGDRKRIEQEWYGKWFNSPYYHVLYKNRDEQEARSFIDTLCDYLNFTFEDKILDLACGKGRHSIYLNQKGFTVDGIDLSDQNIEFARKFSQERLNFYVHDMRKPFGKNSYDYILNMFTSFGYFDSMDENYQVVDAVSKSLKSGGRFVLDFLNPYTVINNLQAKEEKEINGIRFELEKLLKGNFIYKDIHFTDQGKDYHFQEKVKAIRRTEFISYFDKADLKILDIFGDYSLNEYQKESSDRMIFLVKKD